MQGEGKEEEKVHLRSFLEGKEEKKIMPRRRDKLHTFVLLPVKP